jgi:hypothetical protein
MPYTIGFDPTRRVRGGGWTKWIGRGPLCLPIAHTTSPIFLYIHTLATPFPPYNSNVQLLNQRNGDEGFNFFLVFELRSNELAGELLTHYCT